MEHREAPRTRFAASLIFFGIAALTALALLLTALVAWLAVVTGSLIAAALIVGGFFAVIALIVYLLSIRDAIAQIREQIDTIYEVAKAARTGYEWISGKIALLMSLRRE